MNFGVVRYEGVTNIILPLEDLVQAVQALVAKGSLNQGQGRSLQAKLVAAIHQIDRGNTGAASNQIGAFMNQVTSFMSTGVLSTAEGQPLHDTAAAILTLLAG